MYIFQFPHIILVTFCLLHKLGFEYLLNFLKRTCKIPVNKILQIVNQKIKTKKLDKKIKKPL